MFELPGGKQLGRVCEITSQVKAHEIALKETHAKVRHKMEKVKELERVVDLECGRRRLASGELQTVKADMRKLRDKATKEQHLRKIAEVGLSNAIHSHQKGWVSAFFAPATCVKFYGSLCTHFMAANVTERGSCSSEAGGSW